jgi:type IV secretory pathway VirD2 relaxase
MINNNHHIPKNVNEAEDKVFKPRRMGSRRGQREAADRKFYGEIKRLGGGRSGSFFTSSAGHGKGRSGLQYQTGQQRVLVKGRVVKGKGTGNKLISKHMNYITRNGVEMDGKPAMVFDKKIDSISREDLNNFADKCEHDRHSFRLIISPENAHELNLKQYTRELIDRMEKDLSTKLEWVAVNHYNTDNPHTHLFIRGVNDKGNDLYIKRDYMAHGIRVRAQEIATKHLGHRTTLDLEEQIEKDIHKERLTQLDRKMIRNSVDNIIDISKTPAESYARFQRNAMHQRLTFLNKLGLADEAEPGKWQLHPAAENTLKQLGQRGDIIKTMHSSMRGEKAIFECVIYNDSGKDTKLKGVVIGKGLTDELKDDNYIIVKAIDNKAYYIPLTKYSEKEGHEAETGSLVTVESKGKYVNVHTLSCLPLADQIRAEGPTYLDRQLSKYGLDTPGDKALSAVERDIHNAKKERFKILHERGLTNKPETGKPALKYDAFTRLEAAEHDKKYSAFKNKGYTKADIKAGQTFEGYIVAIDKLSDGTYAVMADPDTKKIAVVPYQPGMEKAMDENREVTIEMQRERIGFEPAHISVAHIEKVKEMNNVKGLERG